MIDNTLRKPTKFSKSRNLGEQRANERIKKFLQTLLDKETRHNAGSELWNSALFDTSRDTKQYYRHLVMRLSLIAYEFAIYNDEKYLKHTALHYIKKMDEYLAEETE